MEDNHKILIGLSEIFGALEEIQERLEQLPSKDDIDRMIQCISHGQDQKYHNPKHDMLSLDDYSNSIKEIMQ